MSFYSLFYEQSKDALMRPVLAPETVPWGSEYKRDHWGLVTLWEFLPSPATTTHDTNYQALVIKGFPCARSWAQHATYSISLMFIA